MARETLSPAVTPRSRTPRIDAFVPIKNPLQAIREMTPRQRVTTGAAVVIVTGLGLLLGACDTGLSGAEVQPTPVPDGTGGIPATDPTPCTTTIEIFKPLPGGGMVDHAELPCLPSGS